MPQEKIDTIASILKVWGVHLFAITVTAASFEMGLKYVSLGLAICYTIWKWRVEYLKNKKNGNNS